MFIESVFRSQFQLILTFEMHWDRKYLCHFKVDHNNSCGNFCELKFCVGLCHALESFWKSHPVIKSSSLIVNLFHWKMRLTKLKTLNWSRNQRVVRRNGEDREMFANSFPLPIPILSIRCGRDVVIWKWSAFSNAIKYNWWVGIVHLIWLKVETFILSNWNVLKSHRNH